MRRPSRLLGWVSIHCLASGVALGANFTRIEITVGTNVRTLVIEHELPAATLPPPELLPEVYRFQRLPENIRPYGVTNDGAVSFTWIDPTPDQFGLWWWQDGEIRPGEALPPDVNATGYHLPPSASGDIAFGVSVPPNDFGPRAGVLRFDGTLDIMAKAGAADIFAWASSGEFVVGVGVASLGSGGGSEFEPGSPVATSFAIYRWSGAGSSSMPIYSWSADLGTSRDAHANVNSFGQVLFAAPGRSGLMLDGIPIDSAWDRDAMLLNDKGMVASSSRGVPYYWNGAVHFLGTELGYPVALTNRDEILVNLDAGGVRLWLDSAPFEQTPVYTAFNIDDLVPGLTATAAHGMNDAGVILVAGELNGGPAGHFLLFPAETSLLLVDGNRDGTISFLLNDATSAEKPFRFWLNDDDDDGDEANQGMLTGNSDEPGKLTGFWELDGRTPDHVHAGVDGRCDLIDFFPICLDIKQLLAVLPTTTAGIEYKLKQADAALNFVYTDLTRDHAFDYLTTETATYGTNFDRLPHMAETAAITAEGVALSTTFLDKIKNGTDKGVILVEGAKPSDKPLRLVVVKAGVEIAEVSLNIEISEVEKMYRWVNLRGSIGSASQSVTRPTDTSEPANYPDARTNGKMFIWVHGYNVNEQQSRAWSAEGFKRLYQSGSRAMYTFISWHGDHSQIANSVAPDYWDNITNAFRSSALVPGVVAALPGTSKIITGHSMGNVVVGSAIVDHGLSVTKYFMLNAAMALEAYDANTIDANSIAGMRRNEWASYDSRLWSTEWYQLFPGDGRAGLTWKNRFGDIPNAINFYSSGEEVLNNNDAASGGTPGVVPAVASERAWVGQEMIKGTYHIGAVLTFDSQSGWGFNSAWDIAETTTTHGPHGGTTTTYRHQTPAEAALLLANPDQLKAEPFFRRFQDDRLMTSGGSAAASEYITRADALGGAIPALTFPADRNPIPLFDQQLRNIDLNDFQDGWPQARLNDPEKRKSLTIGRWFHSDAKNIAYRYNYKFWDSWVGMGGLK